MADSPSWVVIPLIISFDLPGVPGVPVPLIIPSTFSSWPNLTHFLGLYFLLFLAN